MIRIKDLTIARTQQKRRETKNRMTDAKIKAMVNKDLPLSPSQAEVLDEADTTEEADTTKKEAASTLKDVIDIYSDDDKDNYGEDEDDINAEATYGGDDEDDNTLHPPKAKEEG